MIDPILLRQLGWSNELIEAVTQAAMPIRNSADRIATVENGTYVQSISCSAIYADSVVNNTFREFRVVAKPGSSGGKR